MLNPDTTARSRQEARLIAAATAREYVEKHTDADVGTISYLGAGSARQRRRHWTFQFRERASGDAKVAHLISRADVVDNRLFAGQTGDLRGLPGAAPQVVIEPAADVILIVRDYLELLSGVPSAEQIRFSVAQDYLAQIVRTLSQWHSRGIFHGDLRPENVAVHGRDVQFVDFFARLPPEELGSGRLDFVAPELRGGERRGSTSGDVYSFARLSVELLRPFRGDFRHPVAALLERQLSWLADYCYVVEPEERPTAKEVLETFFTRGSGRTRQALRAVGIKLDAVKLSIDDREVSSVQLARRLRDHQELRLVPNASSFLRRLSAEIAVDNLSTKAHIIDHDINDGKTGFGLGTAVDKPSLGPNIDSRWRTNIHRLHFGFGLDREHDARVSPRPTDPALVDRDAFYDWHVEASNEIRQALLDNNDFLFTSEVVALLGRRIAGAQAADVTVLRQLGAILAVPDHDRWLYPAFQFSERGEIDPAIQRVNDLLSHSSGLPEDEWSTLALWCLPQPMLGGSSLRDALRNSTLDEVEAALMPETVEGPPFWFNAPQEIRTMAVVEHAMRSDLQGALQGEDGEEILWDKTGQDLVLRWSADSSLDETLAYFSDFVAARPAESMGAIRLPAGPLEVLPSADVLASVVGGDAEPDLVRLDLDRFAFVWEAVPRVDGGLPIADITAIFDPAQVDQVEVMVRRTGTRTVRECAKVALQAVLVNREAS